MDRLKFSKLFKISLKHPLFKLWTFVDKIEKHIYIIKPKESTSDEHFCLKVYRSRDDLLTDESILASYFVLKLMI